MKFIILNVVCQLLQLKISLLILFLEQMLNQPKSCSLAPFLKRKSEDAQEIKLSAADKNANINKKSLKRFKPSVTFEIPGKQVKLQEKETSSSQNHLQYSDCENPFGGIRSSWNVEGSEEREKNFRLGANTKSPKFGVDTTNRKCYKCQSYNHLVAECPSRICYSYGKKGHSANFCSKRNYKYQKGACFVCGSLHHKANVCTNRF